MWLVIAVGVIFTAMIAIFVYLTQIGKYDDFDECEWHDDNWHAY